MVQITSGEVITECKFDRCQFDLERYLPRSNAHDSQIYFFKYSSRDDWRAVVLHSRLLPVSRSRAASPVSAPASCLWFQVRKEARIRHRRDCTRWISRTACAHRHFRLWLGTVSSRWRPWGGSSTCLSCYRGPSRSWGTIRWPWWTVTRPDLRHTWSRTESRRWQAAIRCCWYRRCSIEDENTPRPWRWSMPNQWRRMSAMTSCRCDRWSSCKRPSRLSARRPIS